MYYDNLSGENYNNEYTVGQEMNIDDLDSLYLPPELLGGRIRDRIRARRAARKAQRQWRRERRHTRRQARRARRAARRGRTTPVSIEEKYTPIRKPGTEDRESTIVKKLRLTPEQLQRATRVGEVQVEPLTIEMQTPASIQTIEQKPPLPIIHQEYEPSQSYEMEELRQVPLQEPDIIEDEPDGIFGNKLVIPVLAGGALLLLLSMRKK